MSAQSHAPAQRLRCTATFLALLLAPSVLPSVAPLATAQASNEAPLKATGLVQRVRPPALRPKVARPGPRPTPCRAATRQAGIDLGNLDRSVSPADDFYQFANGGWLASHPIPPDLQRLSQFDLLSERNLETLRAVLVAAAAPSRTGGRRSEAERLLGAFWRSGMDAAAIEADGLRALGPLLARIDAVHDAGSLRDCVADLHRYGVSALFCFGAEHDPDDSSQLIGDLAQGGLGLPSYGFYLRSDARALQIVQGYQAHVARTLELLGEEPTRAREQAEAVLALEKRLAAAFRRTGRAREITSLVHKMAPADLARLTPHLAWEPYFRRLGVSSPGVVNVEQPAYFAALDAALATEPLESFRPYLRLRLIDSMAGYLPQRFAEADRCIREGDLAGSRACAPRWKRVVRAADLLLGGALAQGYVRRAFSPQAKQRVLSLVANLEAVLREDLETLPWMSEPARQVALEKLARLTKKIGYPERSGSYRGLRILSRGYAANVLRARAYHVARSLARIGRPVDRAEWRMTASTVDAYYYPPANEIIFPAGLLQAPFFDEKADDAVNYGAIGAVIGHEMTHGFDDAGAHFDARGTVRCWWGPEDFRAFDERVAPFVRQLDAYQPEPGLHINGKMVVGESLADLGGLMLAYRALQRSLAGKRPQRVDGFTPEQRFFLGWAQIWAANLRPDLVRLQVTADPHPHPRFRVNGPLSNMQEFARAWGCPPGTPMVRPDDQRCGIW